MQVRVLALDGVFGEDRRAFKTRVQRLARQYRGSDEVTIQRAWQRLVGGDPQPEVVAAVASGEEFVVRLRG